MSGETVVLTARDVEELLGIGDCISAVEDVFARWARGEVAPPQVLGVHVEAGGFHIKAGTVRRARHYFATKTNGNFPSNPQRHGLPSIQGVVTVCDADVGTPLALMDSAVLTELRTGAATGVAARYLASPDSRTATVIGCGAQAPSQLRALAAVRPLERAWVFDLDRSRAETFAATFGAAPELRVEVGTDLGRALAASEVCVTCTTSRRPVLGPGMVAPGTFVAAVGADNPEKWEIDPQLMRRSKVVVDSLAQCRVIGDLHHALEAGAMREEDVHAELGHVVAGLAEGRADHDEVIVFDSTGTGLQDVACAAIAYERAVALGRGGRVDFTGR